MTPHASLVLASTSPRRRELLARLGLPFSVVPMDVPESPLPGESPAQTAERLAVAKARAGAATLPDHPGVLVVGADTVVVYRGQPLGKPATPDEARAMLRRLRGKTHRVISGVAVVDAQTGQAVTRTATTRVHLRPLTDDEIDRYVATGDPLDKAGAYAIQNQAFHVVEWIKGCYSNVVGLPLCVLAEELAEFGVSVPFPVRRSRKDCGCGNL
ncbi:MAG TPA: Maf family protein [Chloroflexota bacterium]|nr:Maf family protein [Chloroflexota bacterium]